ncbi:hypothetical protein HY837_01645 [archaeon]|nr:hypothetical protein [archaeon]
MDHRKEKKQLKVDRDVKKVMDNIITQKKNLEQLCKEVGSVAGDKSVLSKLAAIGPIDNFKKGTYKVLSNLPNFLGGNYFADAYEKSVHYNPLDKMEANFREYLNTIKDSITLLHATIAAQKERKEELEKVIHKAEGENWDANRLREELNERTYMEMDSDLKEFFDFTTGTLTEEERERKKQGMLNALKNEYNGCESVCKMLYTYAKIGAETYDSAAIQYSGFMSVKEPLTMMIQSAYDYGTMDELAIQAPDMIRQLTVQCTETTKAGLQALQKMQNHLIASPETVETINACTAELEKAVAQVHKTQAVEEEKNKASKVKV